MLGQLRDWWMHRYGSAQTSRSEQSTTGAKSTRASGDRAEAEALAHLQAAGLKLLERNYLARGGELDLIMRDGNTLVFVEVRYRAAGDHGDGLDSVSSSKQRHLVVAARQFLQDYPRYARWTMRFDVVALGAGGLRWVRNAIVVDGGER
jgi:putative endonuclease